MKKVFTVTEAKAQFSKLLWRVRAGEEITITKWGVPVARLVPVEAQKGQAAAWFLRGEIHRTGRLDAPLSDEILDAFEGKAKQRRRKA